MSQYVLSFEYKLYNYIDSLKSQLQTMIYGLIQFQFYTIGDLKNYERFG